MRQIAGSYFKKNRKGFGGYLICSIVFAVVFFLYDVPVEAVQYAVLLCAAVMVCFVGIDFWRYVQKYRRVKQLCDSVLVEWKPEMNTEDAIEDFYREMVGKLSEKCRRMESEGRIARKEMTDYYSLWVHQIKTPIAAMRILLQAERDISFERRAELEMELFKIEHYVEMVLSYIRMDDMSSDLKLHWYKLDDIIRPAVRKYAKLFILQKIKLNYETIDQMVLTDEKWLGFVVEQLFSNALKYTREGAISIYMDKEQSDVLVIEDTGIGIFEEDLPRVFEKGFTGYNGRTDKKSTGLGLYLCKHMTDKLNHRIWITSEIEKGTKIFLDLKRNEFRKE